MFSWVAAAQQLLSFTFDFAEGWQDRQKQRAEHANQQKMQAMVNHKGDFKDEAVLALAAYPLISPFIPFLRDNTLEAIDIIKDYPPWITGLYVSVCLAVYGAQKVAKVKK